MAHNINSIMYYGQKPWHKLGVEVDKAQTSAEAITAAGLNWEAHLEPLYRKTGEQAEGVKLVTRSDNDAQLGSVGDVYTPLQNKDAFRFFDAVVGEKAAMYHTAGCLGQGEIVWLLAKLPGYIRVIGDDVSEKYLLLTNSHDGTSSVRVLFTPIRVVCQNTLNIAIAGANKTAKIKHSAQIGNKLDYVRDTIGLVSAQFSLFEEVAKQMTMKQVTNEALKAFITSSGLVPVVKYGEDPSTRASNIMEEVSALFEKGLGAEMKGVKGTAWGAFNAVVEYVDYKRATKGDNRAKSLLMGSGATVKQKAWDAALALIK